MHLRFDGPLLPQEFPLKPSIVRPFLDPPIGHNLWDEFFLDQLLHLRLKNIDDHNLATTISNL